MESRGAAPSRVRAGTDDPCLLMSVGSFNYVTEIDWLSQTQGSLVL